MTVVFNDNQPTPTDKKANDGSDTYANTKQLFLSIFHVASQLEVNFKAFITAYNENFQTSYNQDKVFGRLDPIMTFQDTTRKFTVAWDIPAFSLQEAKANLARCNRLAQFMYPAYSRTGAANTLAKPPLMRIRFANLIRNAARGDSPYARDSGLLVAVGGLTITPDFGADGSGFFDPGSATLYPKKITVDLSDITALHEHQIGWGDEIGFNDDEYTDYPFGRTEGVFGLPSSRNPATGVSQQLTTESPPEGTVETGDGDELNLEAENTNVNIGVTQGGTGVYINEGGSSETTGGDFVGNFFIPNEEPDYGGSR